MTDNRDPMVNVLANCLDALEQGEISPAECLRCYPQYEQELWIMLQVVDILQNPPPAPVRPTFRQGARTELVKKIAPPPALPWQKRLRDWWLTRSAIQWRLAPLSTPARLAIGAILMIVAALFSMGTVVAASDGSLPGDQLYPIKLAVEDARLIVLSDPGDARLHLKLAERRLGEIRALADLGRYEETPAAVRRYERHIAGATRAVNRIAEYDAETAGELVVLLDQVLYETHQSLGDLAAEVPPDYRPVFQTAADVSREYRVVLATLYPWEVTGGSPSMEKPAGEPTVSVAPVLPIPPTATWTSVPTTDEPAIASTAPAETATDEPTVPVLSSATPIPVSTSTPVPSSTPTALVTTVPSSTPTPVPLPQPSDTATPVTPATWTPVPTSTPLPTSTPVPTSTSLPTNTSLPTATENPDEPTKFPPGLTKTAEPPGLTVPPGLTNTPEPPGLTKTP